MGLGTTMALNGSRSRGLPSSGQQNIHGLDGRYRCLAASVRGAAATGPRRKPHGAPPATKCAFTSDSHYPILNDRTDDRPRHRRRGLDRIPYRVDRRTAVGLALQRTPGSNYSGGNFWNTDFRDATLRGRLLKNAILRGTDFSDADLRGTRFDGGTTCAAGSIDACRE